MKETKSIKCKEEGCEELPIDNNDGYCLAHICPPSIPLILQHLNDLNENKTIDTAVEQFADILVATIDEQNNKSKKQ